MMRSARTCIERELGYAVLLHRHLGKDVGDGGSRDLQVEGENEKQIRARDKILPGGQVHDGSTRTSAHLEDPHRVRRAHPSGADCTHTSGMHSGMNRRNQTTRRFRWRSGSGEDRDGRGYDGIYRLDHAVTRRQKDNPEMLRHGCRMVKLCSDDETARSSQRGKGRRGARKMADQRKP